MEFIQRHNFFKPLKNGKQRLKIRNAVLKISIEDSNIIGVQEIINERTKKPYKHLCLLNLVNYNQCDNRLVVYHSYEELSKLFNHQNIVIKGFAK